ncbi:cytochrome P450 [Thermocatellispora tengchongensis]|uniref:Cytochrome P450 n=1 Tax=Thermocatellispora tengchongensis TaxID=1073253 RepID=A0A840P9X8_9ACTN|nr:cytochrome P450 [Thermocatellispora tengchongensis]MBB5135446.1 cytochrome P450 [Thermocatellispora tengchongensis]
MNATTPFPIDRECPFAPPAEYARLREEEPVKRVTLPTGKQAWIVTRYADVRRLLADPRLSSDPRRPNFPALGIGEQEAAARSRPFIRTDPPEHTRHRRMLQAEFTVKRVKGMRPAIQATVDRLIDRMLADGPPVDLVPAFANAVSTSTVLNLVGVPADDLEFFRDVTRVSGGRGSDAREIGEALGNMFRMLGELIAERKRNPGEDLLSKLVVNHLAQGVVTEQELLSTIGITIIAGRETTTSMISLGTLMLLERPETLAELRNAPHLLPAAVEELLRALSVADSIPLRVATEDIEVAGTVIPAGDGVICLLAAADHDPEVFPDPGRLDLTRVNRSHMAFGYGIHQCIGQNLARLELEIALGTLIARIPGLKLAVPFDRLDFKHDSATFGIESMPVTW